MCALQAEQLEGQGFLSPLEPRRCCHKPQMLQMELRGLMFPLWVFGLASAQSVLLMIPQVPFEIEVIIPCHYKLEECDLSFELTGAHSYGTALGLRRDFRIGLLNDVTTDSILGTLTR